MYESFQSVLRAADVDAPDLSSRWLTLAGQKRMHLLDDGPPAADETLLFVHGNPTWCFHWRRLINAFRDRYRCIAPDHLGCGLSDLGGRPLRLSDHIQNLIELIDQLDLWNVTLVAQDWGGAIGLGALLARRDRFVRIALYNTAAFPPPTIPLRIDVCRTPLLGRFALQGANLFSLAALRMTMSRRKLTKDEIRGYLAPYRSWDRRRAVYNFVADIPRTPAHPTWNTLQQIEERLPKLSGLPISLTWGMRDWCFTPNCLERFLTHWPNAAAQRISDAGHWVVEDAAEESLAALQSLMRQPTSNAPRPWAH